MLLMNGMLQPHKNIINAILFTSEKQDKSGFLTEYFKHKYIMQPTLTPYDRMMKAIIELSADILKTNNNKNQAQIEILQCMAEAFEPGHTMPIARVDRQNKPPTLKQRPTVAAPRVEGTDPHHNWRRLPSLWQ